LLDFQSIQFRRRQIRARRPENSSRRVGSGEVGNGLECGVCRTVEERDYDGDGGSAGCVVERYWGVEGQGGGDGVGKLEEVGVCEAGEDEGEAKLCGEHFRSMPEMLANRSLYCW